MEIPGISPRTRHPFVAAKTTEKVIGAFFEVYNSLRYGFLESVYAAALEVEFRARGIEYGREVPLVVHYKGTAVGTFRADFVVERKVILEVKASATVGEREKGQLLHYLSATGLEVGLLLHFGPEAKVYRVSHSGSWKTDHADKDV